MLLLLPQLAANTHFLLLRQLEQIGWDPVSAWSVVWIERRCAAFYLLYSMVLAVSIVWAIVSSGTVRYRSGMYRVTPDIAIPVPAGQGQFGTAWWLPRKNYGQKFAAVEIGGNELDALLVAGQQDYAEAERYEKTKTVRY